MAHQVTRAAKRSMPECAASERMPIDPVAIPTVTFIPVNSTAAPTEVKATRFFSRSGEVGTVLGLPELTTPAVYGQSHPLGGEVALQRLVEVLRGLLQLAHHADLALELGDLLGGQSAVTAGLGERLERMAQAAAAA